MGYSYYLLAQVWPKRFKIISKTGEIHEKMTEISNTVFAKKTKFTIRIGKPGDTVT